MLAIIVDLALAALAGFLAGKLMGLDYAWYINIALGLVGGVLGRFVFRLIGLSSSNVIGGLFISTLGACLVIFICKKLAK